MKQNTIARSAGFLYLVVVITGTFVLGYFPEQFAMPRDAAAVAKHVATHEALLRNAIAAAVVCYVAFLLLPLVLFKLLCEYGERAAVLMVAFAIVSVPMSLMNLRNLLDILSIVTGATVTDASSVEHLGVQITRSYTAYRNGLFLSKIFWGLWLLPFGFLVFRCGVLPKLLGLLLMGGCAGYLFDFFGGVLMTGYAETRLAAHATQPAALGEIGICLWLLIVGVRGGRVTESKKLTAFTL